MWQTHKERNQVEQVTNMFVNVVVKFSI